MTYDVRGYLRRADKPAFSIFEDSFETGDASCWSVGSGPVGDDNTRPPLGRTTCFTPTAATTTTATYGSEGLLYSIFKQTCDRDHLLYFAGRPVAQLRVPSSGAATFTYLTTDHLGTPVLAMNQAGTALWRGGFEPFGADYNGAGAAGVFLRFPGQWEDGTWNQHLIFNNLSRWRSALAGAYLRSDSRASMEDRRVELFGLPPTNLLAYVDQNPLLRIDPLGQDWVDWIPSFIPGTKSIKCAHYYDKCFNDALCCRDAKGFGNLYSFADEEEMLEVINQDGSGEAHPEFQLCFKSLPSCQKMAKWCPRAAAPTKPFGVR